MVVSSVMMTMFNQDNLLDEARIGLDSFVSFLPQWASVKLAVVDAGVNGPGHVWLWRGAFPSSMIPRLTPGRRLYKIQGVAGRSLRCLYVDEPQIGVVMRNDQRYWRKFSSFFLLICFLASATSQAKPGVNPVRERGDAALFESLFHKVARETQVPAVILQAIAMVETEMRPARREGGCEAHRTVGLMAIRAQGQQGATLEEVSSISQIPASLLATDVESNIRGAAMWLRARLGKSVNPDQLASWWYPVADYAGGSGHAADLFAAQIYGILLSGQKTPLLDGTVFEVPPHRLQEIESRIAGVRWLTQSSPDYPSADYVPACADNYTWANRGVGDITYVIIHTAQGSYSGTVSWIANCSSSVSAHYVISKTGAITQSLLEKHIGWHAGFWPHNELSIGIEHEGFVDDPGNYTPAMYEASAALVAHLCDKYDIPKDRYHIIGHNEVPGCDNPNGGGQNCHTDPGSFWDWDLFMSYVGAEEANSEGGGNNGGDVTPPTGAQLVGFVRDGDIYVGEDIAGANVSLSNGASTPTDQNGYYSFSDVDPGFMSVVASAPGYLTQEATLTVESGVTNWKSIALESVPPVEDDPDPDPDPVPKPDPESNDESSVEPETEGGEDVSPISDDPESGSENGGISSNHWAPGNNGGRGGTAPNMEGNGAASSEGCRAGEGSPGSVWWFLLMAFMATRVPPSFLARMMSLGRSS
jgi:N-acetyl-anhydromuramyl-L-alanine amidase AmpD